MYMITESLKIRLLITRCFSNMNIVITSNVSLFPYFSQASIKQAELRPIVFDGLGPTPGPLVHDPSCSIIYKNNLETSLILQF